MSPQFIDAANRWGPWYLLISGIAGLYLNTILWRLNVRMARWLMGIEWVKRATQREDLPAAFRIYWR